MAVCGVGFNSKKDTLRPSDNKEQYSAWASMLNRVHGDKYHALQPTYLDKTVCEEWLDFPNFHAWFTEYPYYGRDKNGHRYQLDKDLLYPSNTEYGPDYCCFVPRHINCLLSDNESRRGDLPVGVQHNQSGNKLYIVQCRTGLKVAKTIGRYNDIEEAFAAYKTFRELAVKNVVQEWYASGLPCDPQVYKILMNYEVNIDD